MSQPTDAGTVTAIRYDASMTTNDIIAITALIAGPLACAIDLRRSKRRAAPSLETVDMDAVCRYVRTAEQNDR